MAGVGLPLTAIRDQIADAIDLVVRQERGADGARRVVEVAEVVRAAGGPAIRELLTLRAGRTVAGAPISDALAARLAPRPSLARVAAAAVPDAAGETDVEPPFLPPETPR